MNELKRDMARIQTLVGDAFNQTGGLVALSDGGQMAPEKLQRTLEQTMDHFERSTLELRRLCETYSPGAGGYQRKAAAPPIHAAGYVEQFGYGWLHIVLSTLLPHCRYQAPAWLSDTLARLLDDYERAGCKLPYFQRAMLVIDEHSSTEGRHIYDSRGGKRSAMRSRAGFFRMTTSTRWHCPCCPPGVRKTSAISRCWIWRTRRIFSLFTRGIIGTATSIPAGGPPNRYPADFPSKTPFARG